MSAPRGQHRAPVSPDAPTRTGGQPVRSLRRRRRLALTFAVITVALVWGGSSVFGVKGFVSVVVAVGAAVAVTWRFGVLAASPENGAGVDRRLPVLLPEPAVGDGPAEGEVCAASGGTLPDVASAGTSAPVARQPDLEPDPAVSGAPEQSSRARPTPEGAFPVLAEESRASRVPWRLPELPAQHGLVADRAELGGLVLRAASVVGPSHRGRGIGRQDAYRIGRDRSGTHLVLAVADGMSDSKHSDMGAQVAAAALVNKLRTVLDSGTSLDGIDHREVFLWVARQMNAAAEQRGWEADDVRVVAAAAVVPAAPYADARRQVWLASVGDVSAWRLKDGAWERLNGHEKSGFDPSGLRSYLPYARESESSGVVQLATGEALAVVSDGVGDALENGPEARRWFAQRWGRPPEVGAFLMDVGFEQARMQDDRTAVMVWCEDEEKSG